MPAVRVGITGHRPNKLPRDWPERIGPALAHALRLVDEAARPASSAARPIRLVSGLAEGIDQLAALRRPAGWQLEAALPMPVAEYERDFAPDSEALASFRTLLSGADAVAEPPGPAPGSPRDGFYAALATWLAGHVDMLVAVWDGRPPAGPGGTATVVAQALERGVPVLHLDPAGRDAMRMLSRDEPAVTDPAAIAAALAGRLQPGPE